MITALILSMFSLKGGEQVEKFAGLGLKNLIVVLLFVIVGIVVLKTVLTKHPIPGVSEVVQAV